MRKPLPQSLQAPSAEALFRYQVLSQVLAREQAGQSRPRAIAAVAGLVHRTLAGEPRVVGKRSLYRWLAAFEAQGFEALLPARRAHTPDSVVLPRELLDFCTEQKRADPRVSIPELIRRARLLSKLSPDAPVHRTTVWRALQRMGVETRRRQAPRDRDCRRFSFPHRLQMVLCDGKRFRAGAQRLRRVALFFLDDATRFGLGVMVGSAESASLFLRALYETLYAYGLMRALYVDNGAGFIALDAIEVLRKLGVLFIHGTAGYPEGHGKIERFNRTATEQVLRLLDGNPEVDPSYAALTLRLRHYLLEHYNHSPHEALGGATPAARFHRDPHPLRFKPSQAELRQAFVLHTARRVSNDQVVSLEGIAYEVPRGHAGTRVLLHRHLLEGSVSLLHDGSLVRLTPVDVHANARARRAKTPAPAAPAPALPKGSAEMAFERDLRPIVDPEGGFSPPPHPKQDNDP